jgi:hypothetical protein
MAERQVLSTIKIRDGEEDSYLRLERCKSTGKMILRNGASWNLKLTISDMNKLVEMLTEEVEQQIRNDLDSDSFLGWSAG